MSQPDKHPEGTPQEGHGPGHGPGRGLWPLGRASEAAPAGRPPAGRVDGAPRRGGPPQGDLRGVPFPLGDWGDPARRLGELYRWAEDSALRTADWYLADRVWKRRWARALRVTTVLGVATGLALPLVQLTHTANDLAGWGYLGLLAAAVCVGVDRWFGLTSGWMRDVATAQAVQRRLEKLRFDWASESVREVLGPTEGTASEAAERCLAVLRGFSEDVSELVRGETAEWMVEFGAGTAPLRTQALVSWRRGEGGQQQRFQLPHGNRPNMPRQRPPEGPGR